MAGRAIKAGSVTATNLGTTDANTTTSVKATDNNAAGTDTAVDIIATSDAGKMAAMMFKNTTANKYDFKVVEFEAGEVKELTETELNDPSVKYAVKLGILEAQ